MKKSQPIFGNYHVQYDHFNNPIRLYSNKLNNMTQKEILENITGEKFPEPTPQEIQKEQIEGTPFWIIGNDEKGWNLIMGHYKLTQTPLVSKKGVKEWLHFNAWNVQLSMTICVVTDMLNNQNKQ